MRSLGCLALVALSIAAGVPATAETLGYWRFEGGAADSSGNGKDGTVFGVATFDSACAPVDTIPQTGRPNELGLYIDGAGCVVVEDAAGVRARRRNA